MKAERKNLDYLIARLQKKGAYSSLCKNVKYEINGDNGELDIRCTRHDGKLVYYEYKSSYHDGAVRRAEAQFKRFFKTHIDGAYCVLVAGSYRSYTVRLYRRGAL